MKSGWTVEAFEDVLEDCTGGNEKTLQSEYLSEGRFAVVDQGREPIAGFANDPKLLCKAQLPAIIFGDHTRIFKFADFPFCLGADGVKVLCPKNNTDAKFLYHQLQSLPIPEAGYSRHFKFLKRMNIVLPPIEEQRRIAAILDKADALRQKRRTALQKLDSLTQAIFLDMFGDPATNPKSWPLASLGSVCDVRDGTHDSPKYVDNGFPLVTSKNLTGGQVDLSNVSLISAYDYEAINRRSKVDLGDILMPMIGTIGSPVIVRDEPEFAIKNVALIKFLANSPLNCFVHAFLSSEYFVRYIEDGNRGGTQKFLSLGDIRAIKIPLPPRKLQQSFGTLLHHYSACHDSMVVSASRIANVHNSLQHRAFRGEL
jgi:type I restriction enzyme S subunit